MEGSTNFTGHIEKYGFFSALISEDLETVRLKKKL
jgi:hypothetical protein